MTNFKVESGLQLLARLTRRPSLNGLYVELISEGPYPLEVFEVTGEHNVGKSLLLQDIVYRTLLPVDYGGKGAGVIFFDTDGNMNFNLLLSKLENRIQNTETLNAVLRNLIVFNCYDDYNFKLNLYKIDDIIAFNNNISLLVIDTLTAFYWSEQSTRVEKMDLYLKKYLLLVRKIAKDHKLVLIYTRPSFFSSKNNGIDYAPEKIHQISLSACHDGSHKAEISKHDGNLSKNFRIENNGIVWV